MLLAVIGRTLNRFVRNTHVHAYSSIGRLTLLDATLICFFLRTHVYVCVLTVLSIEKVTKTLN